MATSQVENETSLKETLGEILSVIARRRWWVLCTSCLVAVATLLVVRKLPDRYESEAVLARHQPVSQGYALGAPTMLTNDEAVESIKRELLSRPRLIAIAKTIRPVRQGADEGGNRGEHCPGDAEGHLH